MRPWEGAICASWPSSWWPAALGGNHLPGALPSNPPLPSAGESEADHRELVEFCGSFRFERMGCFTYSAEDGTPAAEMPEQARARPPAALPGRACCCPL